MEKYERAEGESRTLSNLHQDLARINDISDCEDTIHKSQAMSRSASQAATMSLSVQRQVYMDQLF